MKPSDEERYDELMQSVTDALNERAREYDDMQRELYDKRMELKGAQAIIDRLHGRMDALWNLARNLYRCSRDIGCDHCGDGYRRNCSILEELRELGIEVPK